MKRIVAGMTTALVLTAMLIVAAVRSGGSASADTPEQCLEQMFQAMKAGDIAAYLNCFTGELCEQLKNTAKDQTAAKFCDNLRQLVAPIKGRAVYKSESSSDDRVRLVVDRVYAERPWEYQGYRLRREAAKWKIYAIDAAEVHDPPVPYGTPAFPTPDDTSETGNSEAVGQ